jgi:alginate O-acetyltransferase complex protein AlgI
MQFPTTQFLGFFLVVFAVYWALPRHRWRMLWLLAASCAFYMSWSPLFILLLLGSTSVDYFLALRIESLASPRARRGLLALSIGVNLGLLSYFKYAVFALDTTRAVLNCFCVPLAPLALKIILPLGISFYSFEAISYVVDVYRGKLRAIRHPLDYALYILFFPHLVAGPIVRSGDFLPQLHRAKRFSWPRLQVGVQWVVLGLFKKAVLADHLAPIIDPVFARPGDYGSGALWLATLGYAVQIYCDFSGYSDMAIGLAHTLGFKLPRNFNLPYLAADIADFWRRWHVSLSSWLRDYLYVPLGGNRLGSARTYRNLLLVMLLGGLWHGASWTFVAWGLYHGALLALHRAIPWPRPSGPALLRPLGVAATFLLVCVGWVFFRAQTLADAGTILRGLAAPRPGLALAPTQVALVCACLLATLAGHLAGTGLDLRKWEQRLPAPAAGALLAGAVALFFFLLPPSGQGFIYFQF